MYTNGGHEGSVILYRSGCYPNEAIAKVSFIWKAQLEDDDHGNDCLWIWVHPSAFEKLKHELIENFRLERQTPPSDSTTNDYEKQNNDNKLQLLKKKKELAKLSPRLEQFYERMPVYCGHLVILTILKDTLVRFRLLGNTSTAILARVLKVKELHKMDDNESLKTSPWWSELKLSLKNVHTQQSKLWTELTKCPFASRIPPSGVIGLTVCDPREDLPVCRNKVLPKVSGISKKRFEVLVY